jgi:TRAP-type C4-dicarboxylate transport system substrate-binding protein
VSRAKGAYLAGVLAIVVAAAASSGCNSRRASGVADKAGGSSAPLVLRLANSDAIDQPDTPTIQYFADQVALLSRGAIRVQITFGAAGDKVPDVEARTARMVRAGQFDLGLIGARAWDELGIDSFQALQAPFLITSYALLDQVASSSMATQMLAGLNRENLVGLALVPSLLRHPVGLRHPLASLADFAEARIRILPSKATATLISALGAVPVEVSNSAVLAAGAHRQIDGEELSLGNAPGGSIVTANVTFFGKALTIFAGRHVFEQLSERQRRVLQMAAERTVHYVVARPPSESVLARRFCIGGRIELAGKQDLAQLARAARPVYAQLERDPLTRLLIAQIRGLKATTPLDPPLTIPKGCRRLTRAAPASAAAASPTSSLNGTYRWLLTEAAARAFGPPANNPGNAYPSISTVVLRDGKWLSPGSRPTDTGTYTVTGRRIIFIWPRIGSILTFAFRQGRDGSLHLKPVLPMERGDQFAWSGAVWRRVGPPIRTIP